MDLTYPWLNILVGWLEQVSVLSLSFILAEIPSSHQIFQVFLQMPTIFGQMLVIPMEITPLGPVAVFMEHLLQPLPLVAIFIHQIYLTPGGGQLSVRLKFLLVFTPFPTTLRAVASITVTSFTVITCFDHIGLLPSFILVAITLATLLFFSIFLLSSFQTRGADCSWPYQTPHPWWSHSPFLAQALETWIFYGQVTFEGSSLSYPCHQG